MDEVFWSNVVKRWSDATENVIKLKKELSKVQEERNLYRDLAQTLRKPHLDPSLLAQVRGHTREESTRTIVVDDDTTATALKDELQDAEAGLGRAKEEYRRLQNELSESMGKVKSLTLQNEQITARHQQDIARLQSQREQIEKLQNEGNRMRKENLHSAEKVTMLEPEIANSTNAQELSGPSSSALRKEIEALKSEIQALEGDNEDLLDELNSTRDKLQRAEDSNRVLKNSIMKLQDITRHSMTSASNAIASNLSNSGRSRRYSVTSSTRSRVLEPVENTRRHSIPQPLPGLPVPFTEHAQDIAVVSKPYNNSLAMPPAFTAALHHYPIVPVKDLESQDVSFEREFLKRILGDGSGSLLERLPASERQSTPTKKPGVTSYLCPTLKHHPWCPSVPGHHGYIFVGLGKEKDSYKSPAIRNVFVGLPKAQGDHRKFRYLGKYEVSRVKSLTVDDWKILSKDVKDMYAKLTRDKTKDERSQEEILAAYDQGELLVPCVLLRCISFDDQLQDTLISLRDTDPNA